MAILSRTWDREEAISGILGALEALYRGETLPRETLLQKAFYADALVTRQQLSRQVSLVPELSAAELADVFAEVKAELTDIVITKSKNEELSVELLARVPSQGAHHVVRRQGKERAGVINPIYNCQPAGRSTPPSASRTASPSSTADRAA